MEENIDKIELTSVYLDFIDLNVVVLEHSETRRQHSEQQASIIQLCNRTSFM